MQNFQRINNITGWALFAVAAIVYFITVEDTASFWDCGEFIAVSYKLQVPHPPGAPLFLLIGRVFSFLAGGDVTRVAYWINIVSVLSSAFTILFLFWSIVLFGKKLINAKSGEETPLQTLVLMCAGAVGALAYTFSDSFWFSAVEAEVYAMSSFFTAFVVWAILKWELIEDESKANKWIILIAYMVGLSIGVHLLNLVTLPALALIYFFKKYKITTWGLIATLGISGIIVILIMEGVITGLPSIAGQFEIFFVNTLGLPFGSGIFVFLFLFITALVVGIKYSITRQNVTLNTALLALTYILIGYSSYTLVVIRSNYNPPIDENNPENIASFVSYLKREQYGERPLLKGQLFTSRLVDQKEGAPVYDKGEDRYEIVDRKLVNVYEPTVMLPRAWSSTPSHQQAYREILNLGPNDQPSFGDNIYYMMKRQIGHMYLRYFMWNFVGRESDFQDAGWLLPWEKKSDVPEILARNKARNNFYMLPLILGLIGLFFQLSRDKKSFTIVMMLFLLTGVALVLYLNSPPIEPRERDYIYAGSFYAFAFWIGFGVIAVYEALGRFLANKKLAIGVATAVCLSVPAIMAAEGWDDHDRSNRYFSVDSAINFLNSLEPNAILFTGGDNDTFPLWYAQEVEGVRTDVRVIVLSYFNTDWYIDQMTRRAYESEPLPFSLDKSDFGQGGMNDYLPLVENPTLKGKPINLKQYLNLVHNKSKAIQVATSLSTFNSVPSNQFVINVDTNRIKEMGMVPASKEQYLTDKLVLKIKGSRILKSDLMILDVISTSNWERPIYFNNTSLSSFNVDVNNHVIQEGLAYRFVPVNRPDRNDAFVNTEIMYRNMMSPDRFQYRELNNPNVYYTDDYRGFAQNHRYAFNSLATELLNEGKIEQAREVISKSLEVMPDETFFYDYSTVETINVLIQLGMNDEARQIAEVMGGRATETLTYREDMEMPVDVEFQRNMVILNQLSGYMRDINENELAKQFNDTFTYYYKSLN